jgi:cytochrome c biogenesis protein CcmG/thiol:disulfide interchange protein DsbE
MQKSTLFKTILVIFGFAWVWISRLPPGQESQSAIQAPQSGFTAPDFALETHSGDQLELKDLRGKAVILNFWASWCPPCRAEMPAFQQAADEFSDKDLIVLGVNATSQDSLTDVEIFISDHQLEFPILLDVQGQISRVYQIHSLPTTYFIDQEGVIKKVIVGGPIPLSLLRIEISHLLQEDENATDP